MGFGIIVVKCVSLRFTSKQLKLQHLGKVYEFKFFLTIYYSICSDPIGWLQGGRQPYGFIESAAKRHEHVWV